MFQFIPFGQPQPVVDEQIGFDAEVVVADPVIAQDGQRILRVVALDQLADGFAGEVFRGVGGEQYPEIGGSGLLRRERLDVAWQVGGQAGPVATVQAAADGGVDRILELPR